MSSIRQPPWATRTMRPRGIGVVGICQACRCSKEKFDRPTRMVAAALTLLGGRTGACDRADRAT
jgi:hypothetical protein